jgi:hypothetical protein
MTATAENSAFLAAVGPSAAERFLRLDFQAAKGAEAARKFRSFVPQPGDCKREETSLT